MSNRLLETRNLRYPRRKKRNQTAKSPVNSSSYSQRWGICFCGISKAPRCVWSRLGKILKSLPTQALTHVQHQHLTSGEFLQMICVQCMGIGIDSRTAVRWDLFILDLAFPERGLEFPEERTHWNLDNLPTLGRIASAKPPTNFRWWFK